MTSQAHAPRKDLTCLGASRYPWLPTHWNEWDLRPISLRDSMASNGRISYSKVSCIYRKLKSVIVCFFSRRSIVLATAILVWLSKFCRSHPHLQGGDIYIYTYIFAIACYTTVLFWKSLDSWLWPFANIRFSRSFTWVHTEELRGL